MKIIAINGSPRGEKSNTGVMIDAILKGLNAPGNKIENIYLTSKNIKYCTGCYSCWIKTPGKCIINDDMKNIIEQMAGADLIIFGSPLYFNNISGTLKVFFDRMTAAGGDPHKKTNIQTPGAALKFIMVSNCGFAHRSQFDAVSLWIKNVSKLMHANLIGEFYTANGRALTQPSNDQLKSRTAYLQFLESCGRQYLEYDVLDAAQKALLAGGVLDF